MSAHPAVPKGAPAAGDAEGTPMRLRHAFHPGAALVALTPGKPSKGV